MCRSKAANIGIIMVIFHLSYPWLQTCPNQIIPVNEPNCRHGPATQQWKRTSQPLEMFVRISIWMTCAWDGLAGSDGYSFAPRLGFWFYFNSILATSMIGTEPYISWFHSNICIYHSPSPDDVKISKSLLPGKVGLPNTIVSMEFCQLSFWSPCIRQLMSPLV